MLCVVMVAAYDDHACVYWFSPGCRRVYICKSTVLDRLQARREELTTLVALDLACTHVLQQRRSVQTSPRVDS